MRFIGKFVLSAAFAAVAMAPIPASAQDGMMSVTAAVAPRLTFSAAQMELATAVAADSDLAAFYGANGLRMVFTGPDGAVLRAALRRAVALMPAHGIPVQRYDSTAFGPPRSAVEAELAHARQAAMMLRDLSGGVLDASRVDPEIKRSRADVSVADAMIRFAAARDPHAAIMSAAPRHPAYAQLQQALAGPEELAVQADLTPIPEGVWRIGTESPAITALRARLASIGFTAESPDAGIFDAPLAQAVASYQQAMGLAADGIAGPRTVRALNGEGAVAPARRRAILIAMERLRWMGDASFDGRYIWVNIPEFSTTVFEDGQEIFRTRSVVGKDRENWRTPEFSDMMANVVVNPSWNVPRSITIRDYLPRLRANRHALSHLDVVDRAGRVVARDGIDFAAYTDRSFPYRLRQKPSDDNALGTVKFIFPNKWNIYLHDTPSKHLFGNSVRADSNGCIRLGDPQDFARLLLAPQVRDADATFQAARDSGQERWLRLTPAVPVHLVYFTAWPDGQGGLRSYRDIYGRDARIWQAMAEAGFDDGTP
ncbi:L,D-transpeptidase family protein [Paracoccus sp. 1_MG-2023]|uniref:L,D-transpeptidase family protein n=1 Tax=unclassified Paracoccus (in: a-proteobacteria) TaxID=2688777 RepID=UPI001C089931|nr:MULTISPECIES: L,D-transpeptidase family protein [unclassified Paracoccus (in: a-proteobacteria)]MBU2958784.1 L,D-transpeptidase family protein [Paracoccus sp. C2R09]MDO6667777.1 L,D-transpeptidase family protein [Paracoccus sp. 1_MG-2023]